MALSTRAWNALAEISSHDDKNPTPFAKRLGGQSVVEELLRLGHLRVPRGSGRLRRSVVSEHAFRLFDALPVGGTGLSNGAARARSGLTELQYEAAKSILLKSGEITRGAGRGGSVRRIVDVDVASRAGAVEREADMYLPFQHWLLDQKQPHGQTYSHHFVTAHGGSQPRDSGEWARPDLVSVVVTDLEMLPGIEVEVSTYELKPFAHAHKLAGVYEASAHQRTAHLSNLVVEWPLDEEMDRLGAVRDECLRLGVGLLRMWDGVATEVLEAMPQTPPLQRLSQFLDGVMTDVQRPTYLAAIGRPPRSTTEDDESGTR